MSASGQLPIPAPNDWHVVQPGHAYSIGTLAAVVVVVAVAVAVVVVVVVVVVWFKLVFFKKNGPFPTSFLVLF